MENVIYNELVVRGCSADAGVVKIEEINDQGMRRHRTLEIDFAVNRGAKKYYIQSALALPDEDKTKQELRPLLSVKDCFKKIVITKTSMKPWTDDMGIVHLGLYDFLLDEDSLNMA
jgi:predicted AAA+ superfamily ATPase